MQIELSSAIQQRIDALIKMGKFDSREAVVLAAVAALESTVRDVDFHSGELRLLLAEGEHSVAAEGTLDGETAFRERVSDRQRRLRNP